MDFDLEAARKPLVTCCMVTTAGRSALARESARSFARQRFVTHTDCELLVISSPPALANPGVEDDLAHLEAAVREEAGDRSRFIHLLEPHSLGALRNLSLAHARGSYLCQWDDDDLAHPDRIGEQLACLRDGDAVGSMLTEVVHLFVEDNQAFICNWKRAPQGGFPGAVFFRAGASARYPESGEESRRGEDTAFALALQREGKLVSPSRGPLYLYRFHGANTWSREHHQDLVARMAISRALLLHREAALRPFLEELGLPRGVELRGPNGHAFTL